MFICNCLYLFLLIGHNSTTGSCASSSGASGSGRGSSRTTRQHKVGAAAPVPLSTPATNAAAAMAADQPDMPNNGLAGKNLHIFLKDGRKPI